MKGSKNKGIVFGLIMSYAMAYGMEVYNVAIKNGAALSPGGLSNMTNSVFAEALLEASYMGIIVFIVSNLYGNRFGISFVKKHGNPERDSEYFLRLLRQGATVAVMCPSMSLIASILFNVVLAGASVKQLPAIWIGTLLKNFPMAFFWNFFAAAPFSHWLFGRIFPQES